LELWKSELEELVGCCRDFWVVVVVVSCAKGSVLWTTVVAVSFTVVVVLSATSEQADSDVKTATAREVMISFFIGFLFCVTLQHHQCFATRET
jgi:hypothetical protein